MDVYNSHTGKVVELDPDKISGPEALAARLDEAYGVEPGRQLLLVAPSASRLRPEMIADGQKVYMFDLQLISQPDMARSKLLTLEASAVAELRAANSGAPDPANLADNSHMMLSQIVVDRSEWAMRQNEFAKQIADRILSLRPETATVDTATHLALTHMSNHLKALRRDLSKRVRQKEDLDRDIARCSSWSESWARCSRVPGLSQALAKLERSVVADMFDKALQMQYKVKKQLALVEKTVNALQSRGTELLATYTQDTVPPAPGVERLRREMESLTNKVVFDANNVKALADKQLAQRVLGGHEQSLIPDIGAVRQDLLTALTDAVDRKAAAQNRLADVMASISSIQVASAKIKPDQAQLVALLAEADGYKAKVAEIIELPFLYGAFIIELNRRQTWQVEHRSMVDLMVERLASLRDVELERMDGWQQYYMSSGIMLRISEHLVHSLPEIEVNLSNVAVPESLSIEEYLKQLDAAGFASVGDELRGELDAMSQQLAKSLEENGLAMSTSNYENKIRKLESILLQLRFEQQRDAGRAERRDPGHGECRDAGLEERERALAERERALADRERALADRDRALAERDRALGELEQAVQSRSDALAEREAELAHSKGEPVASNGEAKGESSSEATNGEATGEAFLAAKAHDLGERLVAASTGVRQMLETMGLQARVSRTGTTLEFDAIRVKGLRRNVDDPTPEESPADPNQWITTQRNADYLHFLDGVFVDYGVLRERVSKRFGDMEKLARQFQAEAHTYRVRAKKSQHESRNRLALHSFKVGDLVLFLPTRDSVQQPKPWAAFNVGAPHYFLDPSIAAEMQSKEYLIGRVKEISKHTVTNSDADPDHNPFGLAEGVVWTRIVADWPNQGKGVTLG